MTQEQWNRLKTLFHGALELPPEARHAWLTRAAGADAALLQEAAELLAVHDTAGEFLDSPVNVAAEEIADTESLPIGTLVGQYRIEAEIGRGGMGILYRALDTRLHRPVALKVLPAIQDADPTLRERLRREARAAATISHAAVATVYTLEEFDGRLFIVSEFVEGHSLRTEIQRGPLVKRRALALATEIARALNAAHEAGVVHRDLKPENVMIATGDSVKVVDFGIARVEGADGAHITRTGAVIGTPAYMAPEQFAGAPADNRTDIFALGIVLSEMLTGRHPFSSHQRPAIDESVADIINRCLQTDPGKRYQTAGALVAALEHESDDDVALAPPGRLWWWQFHQGAAALVYGVMMWPAWVARRLIGGWEGDLIFLTALIAAVVTAILRLHLWFTSRFYPAELSWARSRTGTWTWMADIAFSAALIISGALVGGLKAELAVAEIAVGVGVAVAFLIVEPATARAAFRTRSER